LTCVDDVTNGMVVFNLWFTAMTCGSLVVQMIAWHSPTNYIAAPLMTLTS